MKEYTTEEIALHNKPGDCWLVLEGKVYDVSPYMNEHPGGALTMIGEANGREAIEAYEDAEHSKLARNMLKTYLIGTLKN